MHRLYFLIYIIIPMMFISGCISSDKVNEKTVSRPLAQDIVTYQSVGVTIPERPGQVIEQPPDPTGPLTLQKTLALTLLHNPRLKAYSWQLRAAEAAVLQDSLHPNPTLNFVVENFGSSSPLNEFEGARSTFRSSQLIELGDKRVKRTRLAQKNQALSAWDFEANRLEVITELTGRYIDVMADQRRAALAQQNLKLAEELYKIVSDRAAAGVTPTSERDKAQVRVTTEQILSDKARRQLDTAKNRLAAMWGATGAHFSEVLGEFTEVEDVPSKNLLVELVTQNPDIARWTTEIDQRQAALELARSRAIPNVTVGAGLRRFNATDENAFVLDFALPLNIIDRNQGGRLEARYNLIKAQAQKQNAQVTVHTLLTEYYNQLLAAYYEVITLSDKTLPAARSAYDAARKAFEKGLTDYLDVLDAERTYVNTERQYVNALADYHKAVAAIEGLIGRTITNITPMLLPH